MAVQTRLVLGHLLELDGQVSGRKSPPFCENTICIYTIWINRICINPRCIGGFIPGFRRGIVYRVFWGGSRQMSSLSLEERSIIS